MTLYAEKRMPMSADPDAVGGVGGPTIGLYAAVALKYGDVVSVSAANTVTKTAVAANALKFAGVVVGGGSAFGAYDYPMWDSAPTLAGTSVAPIGFVALIQTAGVANVVAGAAIAVAATVGLDTTTAGRVLTNAVAGQVIGIALSAAAAAGEVIQILIARR